MNIYEFVSRFDDMIDYDIKIKIGGRKENDVLYDKSFISNVNFRGKKYPFYEKKFGSIDVKYIDASCISLPIYITINSSQENILASIDNGERGKRKNEFISYTDKMSTEYNIRIKNNEEEQIGLTTLFLNESGDITHSFSTYQNAEETHKITRSMSYQLNAVGKIDRVGYTIYKEIDRPNHIETEVVLEEQNGKIITTTVHKSKTQPPNDTYLFATKCFYGSFEEFTSAVSCGGYVNSELNHTLTKWIIQNEQKKDDLLLDKLDIEYIENDDNNLLKNIAGEYVGHFLIEEQERSTLFIRTKTNDSFQNNIFYYTKIDLTDCDPFHANNYGFFEENGKEEYFRRMKDARGFFYVTQEIEGEEVLIWARNKDFEQAEEEWREYFVKPYEQMSKIKPGKILNKIK